MAHRGESFTLVRASGASGVDRVHGVFLFHLFCLPADPRRRSLLPARLGKLLGGDDLLRRRLRARLRHRDALVDRESVVHARGSLAYRTYRRAVYRADSFDREIRARARRRVSIAARCWSDGGVMGSVAAPPLAFLDVSPFRCVHVHFDGVRSKSLCRGCAGRLGYGNPRVFPGLPGDRGVWLTDKCDRDPHEKARGLQPLAKSSDRETGGRLARLYFCPADGAPIWTLYPTSPLR